MTAFERLDQYRQRLRMWKERQDKRLIGAIGEQEPNPEDYGIKTSQEKFIAERIRKDVLGV